MNEEGHPAAVGGAGAGAALAQGSGPRTRSWWVVVANGTSWRPAQPGHWLLMPPPLECTYYIDVLHPPVPSQEEKEILKLFYFWYNVYSSSYLLLFKNLLQVASNDACKPGS